MYKTVPKLLEIHLPLSPGCCDQSMCCHAWHIKEDFDLGSQAPALTMCYILLLSFICYQMEKFSLVLNFQLKELASGEITEIKQMMVIKNIFFFKAPLEQMRLLKANESTLSALHSSGDKTCKRL